MSNSISAICTSNGRSISTGPGRPERIRWKACWKARGTRAGSSTGAAHLVPGLAMLAMSTAWKSSLCSLARGACPVMHRIGIESAAAPAGVGLHDVHCLGADEFPEALHTEFLLARGDPDRHGAAQRHVGIDVF